MTIISAIAADEIEKQREPLVRAMARSIAHPDHRTASDQHTQLASALLDATLATLRNGGRPATELTVAIDRNSVARFGDGLVPVLKDVIGHGLPPLAYSRVTDAFWKMINSVSVPALRI